MKLSIDGMMMLLQEEAISLGAYRDAVGVWTIGAGHTAAAGGIKPASGMTLTLDECLLLKLNDVRKFERRVNDAMPDLSKHEFDGFFGFDYNTGAIKSGRVDDFWIAGEKKRALDVLESYCKAKGKKLAGLVARRKRERKLIEQGIYPPPTPILVYDAYPKGKRVYDFAEIRQRLAELVAVHGAQDNPPPKPARPPAQSGAGGAAAIIVGGAASGAAVHSKMWILAAVFGVICIGGIIAWIKIRKAKERNNGQ